MQLRYLTPFAFLAPLPLGAWLGGAWAFLAAAATMLCIASLDGILGESVQPADATAGTAPRWLPRIYIVLQLAATAWAGTRVADPRTGMIEAAGLTLSTGLTTGIFGFVAAHEMIHSRDPRDRALGLTLLATVFYMQFRIAHVHGHHRRAATPDDPATARLGEGLYSFVMRSAAGQFREAWKFERRRRRRGNRMHRYLLIEGTLVIATALISLRALAFLIAVAAIAIFVLESFNYVAHYGLTRRMGPDGRAEKLGPRHSWNSTRRMNNAALLNMGRHSDHHIHMSSPYQTLVELEDEARLPAGYAAALLTALVPPLWRRTMDPRVRAIAEAR
jgi:alkane 1-monooxygenase